MAAGPVVAMVWEGLDAVKTGRSMLGATNPLASAPGPLSFRNVSSITLKMTTGTQEPSVVTSLWLLAATSAMDPTL